MIIPRVVGGSHTSDLGSGATDWINLDPLGGMEMKIVFDFAI